MEDKEIINEEETIEQQEETIEQQEENNETFTYKIDNNNVNNDYNKNDYNDKKSLIYIGIGALILILIIVFLIIFVNKGTSKVAKFTDIEETMVKGAKEYYKKYSDKLPLETSTNVSTDTLIENSFMKPFSELVDKDVTCTGYVTVTKSGDDYAYFPSLDCKDKYKSTTLTSKIIDTGTVTTGDGLYVEGNEYRYKGDYPNNYVSFDDKEWRIIKINQDSSIKMIMINQKFEKNVWDDRFNSEKNDYSGINNFRVSRILETLNKMYEENTVVSKNNKNLLVKNNWCIGKIPEKNTPINNIDICSETYDNLYIGLIQADEVLKASVASNCVNMYDNECTNYNYFLNINTGWTLNASSDKTYNVFNSSNGSISYKRASNSSYVRPVININGNVLYKSGDGTKQNPYQISK